MVQPNLGPEYALAKDISDLKHRTGRLEQADINLSALHDVAITTPTNGQVVSWSSVLQKWINATGGGGGSFTVSATAPASPANGAGWYNLTNGYIFFYINDGDSSQWVQDTSIANDAGYESRIAALEAFNTTAQAVSVGGTGATSFTSGGYLKGNGTSAVTSVVGIPGSDIVGYMSPNYIINGGFDIWQRGTSFTSIAGGTYTADRWATQPGMGAQTVTQVTDTPGGYSFSLRLQRSSVVANGIVHRIESANSASLVGKIVTVSYWAKTASVGQTIRAALWYPSATDNFATVTSSQSLSANVTSSWTRYSFTFTALSSVFSAGLELRIGSNSAAVDTHDLYIAGVQLEEGSVATTFRRNANSLQGELAACQRYYFRVVAESLYTLYATGSASSATAGDVYLPMPVQLRTLPATAVDFVNVACQSNYGSVAAVTALTTGSDSTRTLVRLSATTAGSLIGASFTRILANGTLNSYIGISAEL